MEPGRWVVTDVDGTVIAEGVLTPAGSSGSVEQGQSTEIDETEQEADDGQRNHE